MPAARPEMEPSTDRFSAVLAAQSAPPPRPPASSPPEPPPGLSRRKLIETTVAQVFGVHARDLRRMSRGRAHVAQARQVAMYLAHVVLGHSLSETGELFRRDRTTVAHACMVVEDLRDDTVFDRVMELLEGILPAILTPRSTDLPLWN